MSNSFKTPQCRGEKGNLTTMNAVAVKKSYPKKAPNSRRVWECPACFKEIGGLKESIGWDTVDVLLAKYNKWKVVTYEDLIVKHLKPTGLNYNKSAKYLQGEALYKMRFGVVLSLLSALKRAYNLKSISYLVFIKIGYLISVLKSKERIVNKKEGVFIRKLIWKNIFKKVIY